LFELTHLHARVDRLLDCAKPHVQELARDTKLSVPAAGEKLRQCARLISRSLGWAAPKV
jgi:DNA-binding IclR family transcriptional regulator